MKENDEQRAAIRAIYRASKELRKGSQSRPGAASGWLMDLGRFVLECLAVALLLCTVFGIVYLLERCAT